MAPYGLYIIWCHVCFANDMFITHWYVCPFWEGSRQNVAKIAENGARGAVRSMFTVVFVPFILTWSCSIMQKSVKICCRAVGTSTHLQTS